MGNICRSPSAEGFFRKRLKDSGLEGLIDTDSAGTHSYHIGHTPDDRAVTEATKSGVDIANLRARKIRQEDFHSFDLIVAMDHNNFDGINHVQPSGSRARVVLMMDYANDQGFDEVPDPYYGTQKDFTLMCKLLDKATQGLLAHVETEVL